MPPRRTSGIAAILLEPNSIMIKPYPRILRMKLLYGGGIHCPKPRIMR